MFIVGFLEGVLVGISVTVGNLLGEGEGDFVG